MLVTQHIRSAPIGVEGATKLLHIDLSWRQIVHEGSVPVLTSPAIHWRESWIYWLWHGRLVWKSKSQYLGVYESSKVRWHLLLQRHEMLSINKQSISFQVSRIFNPYFQHPSSISHWRVNISHNQPELWLLKYIPDTLIKPASSNLSFSLLLAAKPLELGALVSSEIQLYSWWDEIGLSGWSAPGSWSRLSMTVVKILASGFHPEHGEKTSVSI